MQKVFKVIGTIATLLPYLAKIVELYKENKETFEGLFKKGDKEVIPTDREVSSVDIEIPDEAAPPIEKKK